MDFPKSVPGVGLVNGEFIDENELTGQQGSLIPASWGNSVTKEIINVQLAAGLVAAEGNPEQLVLAIKQLVLDGGKSFGIGSTNAVPLASLNDATVGGGLFFASAATAGTWPYTATDSFLLNRFYGTAGFQMLSPSNSDQIWFRRRVGSVFQSWIRLTTTADILQPATAAEAQAFTNTTKFISPATLAAAFKGGNQLLQPNGFQIYPGGTIKQWGLATASVAGSAVNFPVTFPNACLQLTIGQAGPSGVTYQSGSMSNVGFTFYNTSGTGSHRWEAIGN